jgi:hypothetical protein
MPSAKHNIFARMESDAATRYWPQDQDVVPSKDLIQPMCARPLALRKCQRSRISRPRDSTRKSLAPGAR